MTLACSQLLWERDLEEAVWLGREGLPRKNRFPFRRGGCFCAQKNTRGILRKSEGAENGGGKKKNFFQEEKGPLKKRQKSRT